MGRHLTEDERAAIRRMHENNPRLPYRAIGCVFNVTPATVCNILIGRATRHAKPFAEARRSKHISPPPQPEGSCIRPLTPAQLMAGNGRICRSPIRRDAA